MEDGSFHMAATSRNLKDTQNYSDPCATLLANRTCGDKLCCWTKWGRCSGWKNESVFSLLLLTDAPCDPHLALMRYWARLMFAGVPVMVIWRSDDPSMALAILICAPDIWRISLILVPWRPIMQPISWEEDEEKRRDGRMSFLSVVTNLNAASPVCFHQR